MNLQLRYFALVFGSKKKNRLLADWLSVRAFGPIDLEFVFASGHAKDLRKLVFTASCMTFSIKDNVKTKPASSLVSLRKAFNGIPSSCLVERF